MRPEIKRVVDIGIKEVGGADNTGAIAQIVNRPPHHRGFHYPPTGLVDELRLLARYAG